MINKIINDANINKLEETNNKTMVKKSMSVSVSEKVLDKFKKHCNVNSINRSDLIEKWIAKYLKEER